jgi:hypothetical protein
MLLLLVVLRGAICRPEFPLPTPTLVSVVLLS